MRFLFQQGMFLVFMELKLFQTFANKTQNVGKSVL